jgi:signal transduction histidine kinase
MITLKQNLEKYLFRYLSTISAVLVLTSLITAFISMQFEKSKTCSQIQYRFLDLNDVLAREIILGSNETLQFELHKLMRDFGLRDIHKTSGNDNSEVSQCTLFDLGSDFTFPVKMGQQELGRFKIISNGFHIFDFQYLILYLPVIVVVLLSLFFMISLKKIIDSSFIAPISELLKQAQLVNFSDSQFEYRGINLEFSELSENLNSMLSRLREANQKNLSLVQAASIGELASQVAHDVRSPLEVLKGLKNDFLGLPEGPRRRIQMSINRMEEITYNLLKATKGNSQVEDSNLRTEELLSLMESILIEKRIEYSKNDQIEIIGSFGQSSYGLFSHIRRCSLKRVISNLINNGVEALDGKPGTIVVSLNSIGSWNHIEVSDTGGGIPDGIKKRLFTRGFTTKEQGNGLGLSGAQMEMISCGGKIDFQSELGRGSSFTIQLPKCEPPPGFFSSLDLYSYDKIIILDDDISFHDIWVKKLESVKDKIEFFSNVKTIFAKYDKLPPLTLLLSDFELMDEDYDGIDVILKYDRPHDCILTTARSEEITIQERCSRGEIKLLPKSIIQYLDVKAKATSVILIDDDKLIRLDWKNYFESKGVPFSSFASVDKFIEESSSIEKESLIYIDSYLGDDIRGEVESEKVFNLGFINLFLSTGFQKDDFQKPIWIKAIHSKNPRNF